MAAASIRPCLRGTLQQLGRRWQHAAATPAANETNGMAPPLAGVRIIDLTTALAGPSCTMYLADLGAEVIKVEVPGKGDDTRHWGPPFKPHQKGGIEPWDPKFEREAAYFLATNRNKKSVTVNLKSRQGLDIAKRLVQSADVVVENFITGKLAKMGFGYEDVKAINPKIVYCSVTGYGQTGPYSTNPGYDAIIGAESGILHVTGEPDRAPVRPGVPVTDLTAGFYAYGAILAALLSVQKTGKGVHIDVSMFDCQLASMANVASSWLNGDMEAVRHGTAHPTVVPYQVFETSDGFLMIGTGNDNQFKRLATAMGHPDLVTDPRFETNAKRIVNRATIVPILVDIVKKKSTAEWTEAFKGKGFPFGSVNNLQQAFSHPQVSHRKLVSSAKHEKIGVAKSVAPAVIYNGARMPVYAAPPILGKHTREVLKQFLNMEDSEIDNLRKEGAI